MYNKKIFSQGKLDAKKKTDMIFQDFVNRRKAAGGKINKRGPFARIPENVNSRRGRRMKPGREMRPPGAPRVPDKGYRFGPGSGKPSRMPRWEHMPGRGKRLKGRRLLP